MEPDHICRVCMQEGVLLDWNVSLWDTISYRDCFYKYTQLGLEEMDDLLPQFLCELCSADLKKFHLFVVKAIETQNILQQKLQKAYSDTEVKVEDEQQIECVFMVESCLEELPPTDVTDVDLVEEKVEKLPIEDSKTIKFENSADDDDPFDNEYDLESNVDDEIGTEYTQPDDIAETAEEAKDSKGKSRSKNPVMCSYCSKILHNTWYLRRHEQIHKEHREREATCSECGFKAYSKKELNAHKKIHDKNREKKFKCEFCDKAFFHRGACNVHRRIHLGQMVKCPICSKEYYRQVDLDRHVQSHSNTPLHAAKPKPKFKYVVHCKECNKDICSAKFNAHRAQHLNEPLMHCTLCKKDFFSRVSCSRHMKKVHKKSYDNYDDITIYYEKYRPRLSHVLMEQQEDVVPKK
ncbi:uncharacterized protein [Musca autumnalis]|uniref:uncharacterized protein n=1 Tax=Musca autumnalis TaxID=221902 RepID=UPI003CEFE214